MVTSQDGPSQPAGRAPPFRASRVVVLSGLLLDAEAIARVIAPVVQVPVSPASRRSATPVEADEAGSVLLLLDGGSISARAFASIGPRIPAGVHVVVYGVDEEDEREILEFVRLGACGFVLGDPTAQQLQAVVKAAVRGQSPWPKLVSDLLQRAAEAGRYRRPRARQRLTVRQRDVAGLRASGRTAREIAARLGISERTVRNHLHAIYGKLGISGSWMLRLEDFEEKA